MRPILCFLMLFPGCAPYVQVQSDLVTQARRGVALAMQLEASRLETLQALHELRRRQLDEAFDADVLSRAALDPQWVIDARKAYAIGLDLQHQQHHAALRNAEAARINLQAIDQALERLAWLQELQLDLFDQLEKKR